MNKPRAIGTAAETAVVRYLRANGSPDAERPALHGALDEGDITGTPGVAWEVKGGHAAETASDAQVTLWLAEAEVERANRGSDIAVLVCKRKGKGAASAGQWWAHLPAWAFVLLVARPLWPAIPLAHKVALIEHGPAVRVTLADAVALLRRAGYGEPVPVVEDTAVTTRKEQR